MGLLNGYTPQSAAAAAALRRTCTTSDQHGQQQSSQLFSESPPPQNRKRPSPHERHPYAGGSGGGLSEASSPCTRSEKVRATNASLAAQQMLHRMTPQPDTSSLILPYVAAFDGTHGPNGAVVTRQQARLPIDDDSPEPSNRAYGEAGSFHQHRRPPPPTSTAAAYAALKTSKGGGGGRAGPSSPPPPPRLRTEQLGLRESSMLPGLHMSDDEFATMQV